ncbi:hypothetical protein BH09BAC4_BH09BAC4_03080 [soil metagenome]
MRPVGVPLTSKLLTVDATGRLILTQAGHYSVDNVADWSDKVFTENYKLRPLSEVASYIHQYQHLPDVPSATEVVAAGVDAVKMDAKLLEKIEELTLYSIQLEIALEQQKTINQQQTQQLQAMERKHQADIDAIKRLVNQRLKRP